LYNIIQRGRICQKPKLKINKEILKATKDCSKDFSCLSSGVKGLCGVKGEIGRELYFIKDDEEKDYCSYKNSFGSTHICTCPTRKEIHASYGI